MKYAKYLLMGLLLASCSSGSDQAATEDDTTTEDSATTEEHIGSEISGHFSHAVAHALTLQMLHSSSVENLGTDTLGSEGVFSFNPKVHGFAFFRLFFDQSLSITVLLREGEHLEVTGDLADLYGTYQVSGSPSAQGLWQLNAMLNDIFEARDSIAKVMQMQKMNSNFGGYTGSQEAMTALQEKLSNSIRRQIDANPASISNLAAIENLNPEEDFNYYEMVADTLFSLYGNHELIQSLRARVEKMGRLAVGADVPDLVVHDVNGQPLRLSSFRGRVVLLDFWASWCKPCRAENPNVVAAYDRFHEKGFEVFSVSLDGLPNQRDPEMDWKQAIEKDGLKWSSHVSELQGWNSSFVQTFNISGIPYSILIGRDGKIIAKDLRGIPLQEKLTEILEHAKER